jgi:hypothetical protein
MMSQNKSKKGLRLQAIIETHHQTLTIVPDKEETSIQRG